MASPDNELLVNSVSASDPLHPSPLDDIAGSGGIFSFRAFQETFSQNTKKNGTPESEGNVNSAMDIFAPDQSSVSSTNSRISSTSTLEPHHLSSSSEPKDTSDSDRVGQFKVKIGNNYMTLLNEHDQQDTTSLASDSSIGESKGRGMYSPKDSPTHPPIPSRHKTSSPYFPSSSISFPSANQPKITPANDWTIFENKENKSTPEKPKFTPVRPPPAIPDRKLIRKPPLPPAPPSVSPVPTAPSNLDLLMMGMDELVFELNEKPSPAPRVPPPRPLVPPRKTLFSTSSVASGNCSQAEESDQELISFSKSEFHVNAAQISSGTDSPLDFLQSKAAPPIPPRKDVKPMLAPAQDEINSVPSFILDDIVDSSESSRSAPPSNDNPSFQFTLDMVPSSPCWVNFDDSPVATEQPFSETGSISAPVENKPEIETDIDEVHVDVSTLLNQEDDMHWKEMSASPEVKPSTSKKKGGMGYLCLENDDCDMLSSAENIDTGATLGSVLISLPDNDMSPEKPQSQWATFQNEEDEDENLTVDGAADNVSCPNSSPSFGINSSGHADSINDVDLDDFGLGINRLSTDMPDLKGFNRADKGSQNNLVDFSDDRGSAAASTGSRDNIDDDDPETIFDLTAQGDSLKRRRPKQVQDAAFNEELNLNLSEVKKPSDKEDSTQYHVGPAGIDDVAVLAEEINLFSPSKTSIPSVQELVHSSTPHSSVSSRAGTPASGRQDVTDSGVKSSTNPFWSPTSSHGPDSVSHTSLIDSPFDKIVFKTAVSPTNDVTSPTKPSTPARVSQTASPNATGQMFWIPPPPLSQTRSSTRSRKASTAKERIRNLSHGSSSVKKLDLDSASDISVRAESLPVSRADTPNSVSAKQEEPGKSLLLQITTEGDDVFDPFMSRSITDLENTTASSSDPFGSIADSKGDDLFEWIESTTETAANDSLTVLGSLEDPSPQTTTDVLEDVTLILDKFENVKIGSGNTNTNAHVQELPATNNSPLIVQIADNEREEGTTVGVENPDPLLELKKATSVESPNGIDLSDKPLLPEVEIVDVKTSWDVLMRFPRTKRTMSNRRWVPIHMKLNCDQPTNPLLKLFYTSKAGEPFHTISLASHQMQISKSKLQAHYSDEGQVLGKLHAVKLMVVHYKEKQTFSPRRSLAKNPSGFKHACRGKQSIKFGFTAHHNMISFCKVARDAMFDVHRRLPKQKEEEHTATVKYHSRDELLIDVFDELQAVVSESGAMEACKVRVHLFTTSFLSGDPMAKITVNDKKMAGREVVRREDIVPTSNDKWIEIRDVELHESCTGESYGGENAGTCVFYPPDACKFELLRFATSYAEEELPVTIKTSVTVKGARLQVRCIIRMSSKHSANKDPLTQIACEDVMIRIPVPDEWGVYFRVDGRFRNHSVRAKRAAKQRRRPSSEAGITMEASVGVAKYEQAYRAIVWRLPRLPEKNAVQNTPRVFSCRAELTSDQDLDRLRISSPDSKGDGYRGGLDERFRWCEVEYTMPGPTASNVCVRSMSLPNTERAEKFVCYQSHYLYKVAMNLTVEPVGTDGKDDVGTTLCAVQ